MHKLVRMKEKEIVKKEEKEKSRFLSTQNIITLAIGLLSVSVSLFIYLGSKSNAALDIEQITPITYASVQNINNNDKFELRLNDERIQNLIAIPFRITNVGEEVISSENNMTQGNLFEKIRFEVLFNEDDTSKIIDVQVDSKTNTFNVSYEKTSEHTYIVSLLIKYLNPKKEVAFSLLISSKQLPTIKLINNPLAGGRISFYQNNMKVQKENFWYLFKHKYFLNLISLLFMVQLVFVLFYLIYQARILFLDKQNDKYDDSEFKMEQEHKIETIIDQKIEKIIIDNITKEELLLAMKEEHLPIPGDTFTSDGPKKFMSIYGLLKNALTDEWRWLIKDEIKDEKTETKKIYLPLWYDWEEYLLKGVLLLGFSSALLFVLGYFLYFR